MSEAALREQICTLVRLLPDRWLADRWLADRRLPTGGLAGKPSTVAGTNDVEWDR